MRQNTIMPSSASKELFLLTLEPVCDGFSFGGCHLGGGFLEHGHEKLNFFGGEGMANVGAFLLASNRPVGVDDQIAFGISESEEREARILAAEFAQNFIAAGIFEIFLGVALLHDQVNQHKMFFQDGLDFRGLDKLIESFAPSSPGSTENDKQVFLFGGFRFPLAKSWSALGTV
jgi:hypothetical protein